MGTEMEEEVARNSAGFVLLAFETSMVEKLSVHQSPYPYRAAELLRPPDCRTDLSSARTAAGRRSLP